ncbi:hypothetical protein [Nocardioides limicola]|uniref:hypothetical protein n=1 Tax=Nocardioides limicola TaxID=2803368 RepID=UPI00193BD4DD|nr:hypothetical protein [Nocardioides sp. DJM-14]
MITETFTVCALPHTVAADAPFHVSLFIAPRLAPSQPGEALGGAEAFVRWPALLRDAKVELRDQAGPIDCSPLRDALDETWWERVFEPATPVLSQQVPQWQQRDWRSFDAAAVAQLAKVMHLATIYASPTEPPSPQAHPLQRLFQSTVNRWLDGRRRYDERDLTERLDEMTEGQPLIHWERQRSGRPDGREPEQSMAQALIDLHRVRRFYERPESAAQLPYRERPDPDAVAAPLPPPAPEFHERVAMLGDHPEMLRRAGLVLDLRADHERLRRSRFLSAKVTLPGTAAVCHTTRVACRTTDDDGFVSRPSGSDWHDGALVLGEENRFTVLDIDTDGSALKAERFLWGLPRLLKVQRNADPVNAATPALRGHGFTIARTGQALTAQTRLARQTDLESRLSIGEEPDLTTEDVTRGLRVDVWDSETDRWASLHSRLAEVAVTGHGSIATDLAEEGFIQGTSAHETPGVTDSPVHVHEAMFGWEGWSLSAPRPGKRIRKATPEERAATGQDEVVEETPAEIQPGERPPHPIRFTHRVRPGSLPRLRYGRSYAFRAWAVDLAGNSRPHDLTSASPDATPTGPAAEAAPLWSAAVRTEINATLAAREVAPQVVSAAQEPPEALLDLVGPRLRELTRLRAEAPSRVNRAGLVAAATAAAVRDLAQPLVTETAVGEIGPSTVTRPRPFLRWDPVEPPVVVPLRRFTEGESVQVVVVRSGVTQDPETLAVTVVDPVQYAAEVAPELGYGATSERHLGAPKTTQMTAELHGRFDAGIGTSPAQAQQMLGWAISEDGSLLDVDRADLDNPPARIPQPGVRLEHSAPIPQAELKSLPLPPGEAPAPGQYVVHDTEELTLPYLPDPMAAGVSFVFPDAGRGRQLPFPFGGEGFTTGYGGSWPRIEPYRMVLSGSPELDSHVTDRTIGFSLPPGDTQRMRLSSSLRKEELGLLGAWRSLAPAVRENPDVEEAAADGWLWGLTPAEEVLLVHAVPRPVQAPRPTRLAPVRSVGRTSYALFGGVDVHGPSTDSLLAHARWTDPVDDLSRSRWHTQDSAAIAFQTRIDVAEDIALLWPSAVPVNLPGLGVTRTHPAVHEIGDTRHHRISFRFRALTRFREYFHPSLLTPGPVPDDPGQPYDDGQSVVSSEVVVDIPSSARPAAPVVHSVLPLFRWDFGEEPEQPMARRHVRRTGVRIYLERPWFSSGDGELLAVLLAPGGDDEIGEPPEDESGFPYVSKVGQDPVWHSAPVPRRAMTRLQLDNLLRFAGIDDRPAPGRPCAPPETLPLTTINGAPQVVAVGYRPQFNEERGLWYVDVALDPGATFWPFVRLAVARYQPSSVPGCHLSAPVRCDFVQLPPERTVSVSRTDASHARVVVSGPIGLRTRSDREGSPAAALSVNRVVYARLQRRDPLITGDLGWETLGSTQLTLRGQGAHDWEAAWVGELAAPEEIWLRRPSDPDSDDAGERPWRITIEEWERLPGDPLAAREAGALLTGRPRWEQRLVFADEVML